VLAVPHWEKCRVGGAAIVRLEDTARERPV